MATECVCVVACMEQYYYSGGTQKIVTKRYRTTEEPSLSLPKEPPQVEVPETPRAHVQAAFLQRDSEVVSGAGRLLGPEDNL